MKQLILALALAFVYFPAHAEEDPVADELNNVKLEDEFESTKTDELLSEQQASKADLKMAKKDAQTTEKNTRHLKDKNKVLAAEIKSTMVNVRIAEKALAKLKSEHSAIDKKVTSQQKQLEQLRIRAESLKTSREKIKEALKQSKGQLAEATKETADLNKRKKQAERDIVGLKASLKKVDHSRVKRLSENKKLRRQVENSEAQVQIMKNRVARN